MGFDVNLGETPPCLQQARAFDTSVAPIARHRAGDPGRGRPGLSAVFEDIVPKPFDARSSSGRRRTAPLTGVAASSDRPPP
jgi:hypothetical protein